ncbi:MAG: hypothetical protein RSD36_16525 [Terrisporobacter sp.]
MKEWKKPQLKSLDVDDTKDNCNKKDIHQHDAKGHSSSSCNCVEWIPIGPSFPINPAPAS